MSAAGWKRSAKFVLVPLLMTLRFSSAAPPDAAAIFKGMKAALAKKTGATTIYQLEEIPRSRWYYSRILDSIAADSMLPVERDYYDVANVLWRKETFPDVPVIDGIPTPVRIRMEDKESGDWSEIRVSDVVYDAEIPDEVFDPAKLRETASHPLWTKPGK